MKAIADFICSITELLKASAGDFFETQIAKVQAGLLHLTWGVAMVLAAGVILVAAVGLLVAALFFIFYAHLGGAWASFICGAICLGVVLILAGLAHCMMRR